MSNIPTPLNDDIVVVLEPEKEQTSGGVYLPQLRTNRDLEQATVVAVGPGRLYPDFSRARMDVAVGEKVLFSRLAGVEVKYESGSYLVLNQTAVLAVVD